MFFDDLPKGYRFETATRTLSEDDIIAFARQWDPQSFHTDPEAAKASPYGGLIASGFHTLLTAFNLTLGADVWNEASMGSPGIDSLRWIRPVRPGDTLRVRIEVTSSTPSQSRSDRGRTGFQHTVLNQNDEVVMTYHCVNILARRCT
ncbi:MAG: MaoC family dehydratase [Alphaproteobacteria bacterium]